MNAKFLKLSFRLVLFSVAAAVAAAAAAAVVAAVAVVVRKSLSYPLDYSLFPLAIYSCQEK